MPFSNEILGGNKLVRDAIESSNWEGPDAGQGWAVMKDGSAYFSNLNINNSQVTLNEFGDGSVQALAVRGNDFYLGGRRFSEILAALPWGVSARGTWTANSTPAATEHLWFGVRVQATAGRLYKVTYSGGLTSSVTDDNVILNLRDGGASLPTTGSPRLTVAKTMQAIGGRDDHTDERVWCGTLAAGAHHLGVFVARENGTGNVNGIASATNPGTIVVEDIGPADLAPNVAGNSSMPAFGVQLFSLLNRGGTGPGFEQMSYFWGPGGAPSPASLPNTGGLWDVQLDQAQGLETVWMGCFPDLSSIASAVTRIEVSIPSIVSRSDPSARLGLMTHTYAAYPATINPADFTDHGMDVDLAYNSPIIFTLNDSARNALLSGGARGIAFRLITGISGEGDYRLRSSYNNPALAVRLRVYRTV